LDWDWEIPTLGLIAMVLVAAVAATSEARSPSPAARRPNLAARPPARSPEELVL
jgi:hypothetical protein